MQRSVMIQHISEAHASWDVIVIGGGATGLGTALDACTRGYATLLLERGDFAKGTSSRSTKLIHGGVRYLQQGNVALVFEALRERGILRQNAPHLVSARPFLIPVYRWGQRAFYRFGMGLYDLLAGRRSFGRSQSVAAEQAHELLPTLAGDGLRGGVIYYDGQFDDARYAINLARTAERHGATVVNYMEVQGLCKDGNSVTGVKAHDHLSGKSYTLHGRVVINATGPFSDEITRMDEPDGHPMIAPSQGVHIVLDSSFLPGDTALLIPRTRDGRVLFAIPWRERVIIGTTDTAIDAAPVEPKATEEELDFLLSEASAYLTAHPAREDIKSVFVGVRPLTAPSTKRSSSGVSREHSVHVAASGLVAVTGGKWTTYRVMAKDTVDRAAAHAGLPKRRCVTDRLHIHGYDEDASRHDGLAIYGADAPAIRKIMNESDEYAKPIHSRLPVLAAEVVWAARHEMAESVEDVLSRRTRALLFDARACMEAAPLTARIMARELNRDAAWERAQVEAFCNVAAYYLVPTHN